MRLPHVARFALCFAAWFASQVTFAETPSELLPYAEHDDLTYVLTADGSRQEIDSPAVWAERRRHVVGGMEAAMGPFPVHLRATPLEVEILEQTESDGFIRRKVSYRSDPAGPKVRAWLQIPNAGPPGPRPAVLCLHQTTPNGKDSTVGLSDRASMHYALELVRRGFVTISPDYPSLGEHEYDFAADDYESGSMKAIVDNSRAIDLLVSLPEVDPERIGAIGHSLGGHNGLFTAVFEPRIKAVVSCCGFTSFPKYMGGNLRGWAGPRYMPRIEQRFELSPDRMPFDFAEVLAAIAPRAVFVVAPTGDDNFDVEGVRDGVRAAAPVFALHGAAEKLQVIYPDCQHDFPSAAREQAYQFLESHLTESKSLSAE